LTTILLPNLVVDMDF